MLNRVQAFPHVPGNPYRLTVREPVAHQFELTIEDLASGQIVFSQTVTDSKKTHIGGFGGVYNSAGSLAFDDFQLLDLAGE